MFSGQSFPASHRFYAIYPNAPDIGPFALRKSVEYVVSGRNSSNKFLARSRGMSNREVDKLTQWSIEKRPVDKS